MCEALMEIMEPEIKKAEAKGEVIGVYKTLSELVKDKVISLTEAARRAGVSEADFKKNTGLTTA